MWFTDVTENMWFYQAVKYAYDKGFMTGVSDSEFAPDITLTRAMFVSALYRIENEPTADGELNFSNLIGIEDSNFLMIEDKDFIKYCMSRLSADERKFIEYRYYDEKSQKEISEIMGISQMQVSRMEKRTLKKLRNLYFRD